MIELDSLTKHFKQTLALDDATGSIPAGRIGLLGPNGAGKSTLMKLLLGLLYPTSGGGKVLGHDIILESIDIRKRIGYMPENECLPDNLNAVDFVSNLGRFSGMKKSESMQRAHEVFHYLGMGEERYRRMKGYSGGMRQKVKLAQALVHDPEIVFLDEPTAALDPFARDEMLRTIREIANLGNTNFILSTHILHDVEQICDTVVIINRGKVLTVSPIKEIIASEDCIIELRVSEEPSSFEKVLRDSGLDTMIEGSDIVVFAEEEISAMDDIVKLAAENHFSLRHLDRKVRDLDEGYLDFMKSYREKEKEEVVS